MFGASETCATDASRHSFSPSFKWSVIPFHGGDTDNLNETHHAYVLTAIHECERDNKSKSERAVLPPHTRITNALTSRGGFSFINVDGRIVYALMLCPSRCNVPFTFFPSVRQRRRRRRTCEPSPPPPSSSSSSCGVISFKNTRLLHAVALARVRKRATVRLRFGRGGVFGVHLSTYSYICRM